MKEKLLLLLFFLVVASGFIGITLSVAKVFTSSVNSITMSYFPESNIGIGE